MREGGLPADRTASEAPSPLLAPAPNRNLLATRVFVDELVRGGLRTAPAS